MSESNSPPLDGAGESTVPDTPIQFDHAEFQNPATSTSLCAVCQNPIVDSYYETGGKIVCPSCEASARASLNSGSRLMRAIKALALGSAAAFMGAVLYYLFVRITDWNLGLISILVGLMVGGSVRKASGNRGGAFYQVMAVVLCYLALVGMHVPFLVEAVVRQAKLSDQESKKALAQLKQAVQKANAQLETDKQAANPNAPLTGQPNSGATGGQAAAVKPPETVELPQAALEPVKRAPTQTTIGTVGKEQPASNKVAKVEKPASSPVPTNPPKPAADHIEVQQIELAQVDGEAVKLSPMSVVLFFLVMGGLTLTAPIQVAMSDPISGLIFAFALWEAWKINIRPKVVTSGPFRLNAAADPALNVGGAVHGG